MSSTLSQRGPNATTPAKLPGIQTSRVADPAVRASLEALREWVEVRLGSRGDKWERAVTARELETRLTQFQRDTAVAATPTTATSSTVTSTTTSDSTTTDLKNRVANLTKSVAQLQASIADEQDAVSALQAELEAEQAAISALQASGTGGGLVNPVDGGTPASESATPIDGGAA